MKSVLAILVLFCQIGYGQNKIYDLSVNLTDGSFVSMAKFKGHKIIVAVSSEGVFTKKRICFLDSLSGAFPDIHVLIFPAADLGVQKVEDSILRRKASQ